MKKTIISLVVLYSFSVSAHAMTVDEAKAEVAQAEHAVESAHDQVIHNNHSVTHTTMQDDRDLMNVAGQMRAEAYADQRAAEQEAQNQKDAAEKAQANAERDAKIAEARLNSPSATASHSKGWVMAPGIIKESNPAGYPTHQIGPATHLDSSVADQQAAAVAKAEMAQHEAELSNYGVKRSGTATYSEPARVISYSGPSTRPNTGATITGATINVAANTLKPDTQVQITDTAGHKSVVKASTLTPSTQVSIPFHSAFQHAKKGGNNRNTASSQSEHGTGTGADNAHDHAFGGHVGAGGGFHM
ncbi:hypothetical protein F153LOC_01350 [Lelliottia sp. F153]|uniref:hypothetical protein n=1 Tax=unclassified Lelliottia TaxID=2642424 RepID=UPI000CBECEC0|nr:MULTISPECIES: hypothetical protein [unclassified Lelliottia]PLY55676.1 hypothetical protein F153LOC_01350 [Lelliottia sp. F153]